MTHGHLSFDIAVGFGYNTTNDDDGGTTERETCEVAAGDDVDDHRENSNNGEQKRTDESDTGKDLGDVLSSRTTGTDTGNGTAVVLQVVSNFYGVERNGGVEVSKRDDEYKGKDRIYNAVGTEEIEEACPEGAFRGVSEHFDRRNDGADRRREDDRHNTGHVDLERKGGGLTAVHLSADNLLSILDRDSAFRVGHPNDEANQSNNHSQSKKSNDDAEPYGDVGGACLGGEGSLAGDVVQQGTSSCGQTGDDVGKQDHGDTVADTAFVDLFGEPHYEGRTCAVAGYDNDGSERTVFNEKTVVLEEVVVTDRGNETESNGYVSGVLVDLLAAFIAFLGEIFQVRDSDAEKLHYDGCSDVRVDTQSKQSTLCECGTSEDVQIFEDGSAGCKESSFNCSGVDKGNRDRASYSVEQNNDHGENEFRSQIGDFPGVFQCSKHFTSPRSFHLLLRSFPLRLRRRRMLQRLIF